MASVTRFETELLAEAVSIMLVRDEEARRYAEYGDLKNLIPLVRRELQMKLKTLEDSDAE